MLLPPKYEDVILMPNPEQGAAQQPPPPAYTDDWWCWFIPAVYDLGLDGNTQFANYVILTVCGMFSCKPVF